jgi:hypothetical protein
MGIATAILWFWNFFLAITWPTFVAAYTPSGAFGWYAAWCLIGFVLILLFVPETRNLTLEQLDQVFEKRTGAHMRHGMNQFRYVVGRYLMRRRNLDKPVLIASPEDLPIDEGASDDPGEAWGHSEDIEMVNGMNGMNGINGMASPQMSRRITLDPQ